MRPTAAFFAARTPAREPVPFQDILPLKIKNRVSGKGDNTSEVSCVYEMSLLFACFKKHDFLQTPCVKEMETLQTCYLNHLEKAKIRKEREAKGILTPGEKKLSSRQINLLLKKFPNVK